MNNQKVVEFLDEWLQYKSLSLRSRTLKDYRWIINHFIIPKIGEAKIQELNFRNINEFIHHLYQKNTGIRTIHYACAILRTAFNHAIDIGYILINPVSKAVLPRMYHREMKILNLKQIKRFLIYSKLSKYHVLYYLAITTGMRISEIMGLKWQDIDYDTRTLFVRRQVSNLFTKSEGFTSLKTRTSLRNIPLSKKTIKILANYRNQKDLIPSKNGVSERSSELVFTSSIGTIITYSHLRKDFKSILDKAGLPDIRIHDLRHTCATLLIQRGIPLIAVSRLLGHSKPSTTLDFYGHFLPQYNQSIEKAMNIL